MSRRQAVTIPASSSPTVASASAASRTSSDGPAPSARATHRSRSMGWGTGYTPGLKTMRAMSATTMRLRIVPTTAKRFSSASFSAT